MGIGFLLRLVLLVAMNFQSVLMMGHEPQASSIGGRSSRLVSSIPQEATWLTRQAAAALRYRWLMREQPGPPPAAAEEAYQELALRNAARAIKARNRPAAWRLPLSLDKTCATPQSLMLHSVYGAENMAALADAIHEAGLETTTYRAVLEGLRRGQCPPENSVVVSIDDLSTQWIRPGFREMIQVFSDRGMVVVLGVVIQDPQKPAIWEYLRGLERQGHEVASHTMNHLDLPELDEKSLHIELAGSYQVLCENLGRCPVTLVLPFGDLDEDDLIINASADYTFVVGIQGGRSFEGAPPYYLGRIPPDTQDQHITVRLLHNSFGP